MSCHVMPCHAMSLRATSCHAMSLNMPCHAMSCHVMQCSCHMYVYVFMYMELCTYVLYVHTCLISSCHVSSFVPCHAFLTLFGLHPRVRRRPVESKDTLRNARWWWRRRCLTPLARVHVPEATQCAKLFWRERRSRRQRLDRRAPCIVFRHRCTCDGPLRRRWRHRCP